VTAGEPGPLAEEAGRLVEALGEWARGALGDIPRPDLGNGPECQVCPICQLLAVLRHSQPETFAHLADASASMMAAARTLVERHAHSTSGPSGVERIDLDDATESAGGVG